MCVCIQKKAYLTIGGVCAVVSMITGVKFPVKLVFCINPLLGTKPVPWMSPELCTNLLKKGTRYTLPFTTGSEFIWLNSPVGILSTGVGAGYKPPVDMDEMQASQPPGESKDTNQAVGIHRSVSADNVFLSKGRCWYDSNIQHNFSFTVIQFCLIL